MTHETNVPPHPLRRRDDLPDLLTIAEVAEYLQVSVHTLYAWRRQGKAPEAVTFGKHLRFPKAAVIEWTTRSAT